MSLKDQYDARRESISHKQIAEDFDRLAKSAATIEAITRGVLVGVGMASGLLVAYFAGMFPASTSAFGQSATIGVMVVSGILAVGAVFATFVAAQRYARSEALRLELMLTEAKLDQMHETARSRLSDTGSQMQF